MVSLVVLSPTHDAYTLDTVHHDLEALFRPLLPPREVGNFVVESIPSASYSVQCTVPGYSGLYSIQNVAGPYAAFSDFLEHIGDPELKELAASQPFWISVDRMHSYESDREAYRFIGQLLARLAPEDAAVLVHPSKYLVRPFTPEVRRLLASGGERLATHDPAIAPSPSIEQNFRRPLRAFAPPLMANRQKLTPPSRSGATGLAIKGPGTVRCLVHGTRCCRFLERT